MGRAIGSHVVRFVEAHGGRLCGINHHAKPGVFVCVSYRIPIGG
jgi:hypothetical protein